MSIASVTIDGIIGILIYVLDNPQWAPLLATVVLVYELRWGSLHERFVRLQEQIDSLIMIERVRARRQTEWNEEVIDDLLRPDQKYAASDLVDDFESTVERENAD